MSSLAKQKSTDRVAAILRIQGNTYREITEQEAREAVFRAIEDARIENPERPGSKDPVQVEGAQEKPGEVYHELRWINQVRDITDVLVDRYVRRELTGRVVVICNCGLVTGWMERKDLAVDYWENLRNEHTNPRFYPYSVLNEKPRHGDTDLCEVCGGPIEYIEASASNDDVLDSWWSHLEHPADGHTAKPLRTLEK